ncbi:MAG: hypothetical protein R3C05_00055 [Pirellulaceae bacterium]
MKKRLPPGAFHSACWKSRSGGGASCTYRQPTRRTPRCIACAAIRGGGLEQIVVYLNRLSDYLFVVARVLNQRGGIEESIWGGQADVDDSHIKA